MVHSRLLERVSVLVVVMAAFVVRSASNHIGKVSHLLLHLHSLLPSRKILTVLLVASQTSCKDDARVNGNHRTAIWVREATVTTRAIRVTTGAICLVPDTLRHVTCRSELGVWGFVQVYIWKKLSWLVLGPRRVQGGITPVVSHDIGVSARAIAVIFEALPILGKVGDRGLLWWTTSFTTKLWIATGSLVFIYCEHGMDDARLGI